METTEQLIKKNCETGEYSNIFPVTSITAIKNLKTGKCLDEILEEINHLYLPFKDNSRLFTRQQVPDNMRRKGLWITYVSCKNKVITEYYNSTDYSNKAWGDSSNWIKYIDESIITEAVEKKLAWYKA